VLPDRFFPTASVLHFTDIRETPITPCWNLRLHNQGFTSKQFSFQKPWEYRVPKGTVKIVVEHCKACGFCVEFYPTKVLALSSAFNSQGYHMPHVLAPEKRSGCDLCGCTAPISPSSTNKNGVAKQEARDEG
jgi:ferredoxin